jgi:hypothetical protein
MSILLSLIKGIDMFAVNGDRGQGKTTDGLKYDAIIHNDSDLPSFLQKAEGFISLLNIIETTTRKHFNKEGTKVWKSYSRLQAFWQ